MLENTNALIGALIAVLGESKRLEGLIAGGSLSEEDEERMLDRAEQVQLAYGDLSQEYERRRPDHPRLLTLEALKSRIDSET